MSRLEVPLQHKTLWHTGDLVLRAFVDLSLKDASGNWHSRTFRVDSGSDMTSMWASKAKSLGLPMPQQGVTVPITTITGMVSVVVRSGFLRMRVDGMDPVEYVIPCHFLGDPNAPLPPGTTSASFPPSLLALIGVVDKLRMYADGDSKPGAPHGTLVVEKK